MSDPFRNPNRFRGIVRLLAEGPEEDPDFFDSAGSKQTKKKPAPPQPSSSFLPNLGGGLVVGSAQKWPQAVLNQGIEFELDHGEHLVALTCGGRVMGSSVSYDIELPTGEKWEVKSPHGTEVRSGAKGRAAAEGYANLCKDLLHKMAPLDNVFLDPVAPGLKKDIQSFIAEKGSLIEKGEISGSTVEEMFELLRRVKKLYDKVVSRGEEATIEIMTNQGTGVAMVPQSQALRIASLAGIPLKEIGGTEVASILSQFKEEDLKDPKGAALKKQPTPEEVFNGTNGVIIVNKKGYYAIPHGALSEALSFLRVTMGTTMFQVEKAYIPT